jgi:hypothetical protein
MKNGKYLIKKLNYTILSNGTMIKTKLILRQYLLKVKLNPLKSTIKSLYHLENPQD